MQQPRPVSVSDTHEPGVLQMRVKGLLGISTRALGASYKEMCHMSAKKHCNTHHGDCSSQVEVHDSCTTCL